MGGSAFARFLGSYGKPVHTPRMSPEVYHTVASHCQKKLEALFERVSIPRDAPSKIDYGDVDLLVEGTRLETADETIWTTIKEALGAELQLPNGASQSYAIPHPTILEAYVQVDVEISPGNGTPDSVQLFEWTLFMKGDSDLVQIIGIAHRPLGLLCNDRGLHVRLEQIELYDKKRALLFLTRDPVKAMEFYGFDVAKYHAGFANETELFDWVSTSRLFYREVFENRVEKANDRSRQAKRPMYRRFVQEYMPAHPDRGNRNAITRDEVLQEALHFFNKHAEYEEMIRGHRLREAEEDLWKGIRERLPVEGNSLSTALKSLRRWVVFKDGKPGMATQVQEYTTWISFMAADSKDAVLDWVLENWKEAKALEKARSTAAKEAAKRVDCQP
ncbi:hypothetical protein LEMA_P004520.1 [Plenodomus lingam JN3]|uniref:Uncharacterized protein n=1 Tax=Leptosphaeria maculans (strain JN3 / isolate v23.1.3 / race Av1-4-5-6-7-8) TaxID=985895 RepID=E5AEM6_LEPMJ|nr:hypothetical protein LEMA_P004520.1 [Plenodomus lingam JN3]CBY01665.1 hypothetical protein LEMA_P004520.1 [Plenodomus lingam JN3]